MKYNCLKLFFIFLIGTILFFIVKNLNSNSYKVLDVVEGDTFYIDLNSNNEKDSNELFKLNLVKTFREDPALMPGYILEFYSISSIQASKLGKSAKEYSKQNLLGKLVKVNIIKETPTLKYAEIYLNDRDFAISLLERGLAYSYNPNKFDKYILYENIKSSIKLSKPDKTFLIGKNQYNNFNLPIYLYFIEPNYYDMPCVNSKTSAVIDIIKSINNAKKSVKITYFGYQNQNEFYNALLNAKKRGVEIKGVVDSNLKGDFIYKDSFKYVNSFNLLKDNQAGLMHNKFIIIDDKLLYTGSMNISETGSGGYNINTVLKIKNPDIISVYNKEFSQMLNGKFQILKSPIISENIRVADNINVSVYFSPNIKIVNKICNLIKNSKDEILVSAFYLTNKTIGDEIIKARLRGVKVFVILDALGAAGRSSIHNEMRKNGIFVKIENYGGKNHEKNMLIDKKYLITGSANFTYSGYTKNDENTIIISSPSIANVYRAHFFRVYNSIDKKYLFLTPKSESFESINSCKDHIDNDFDGLIDKDDSGCK